jgi:hypothetical protein
MNAKQIGLSVVLADFAALSAYAVYEHGYVGIFEMLLASPAGWLAMADLTIALGLVLAWMWSDARDRGAAFFPFAALTLALGSVGPLLYLILRSADERATTRHALEPAGARGA